VLYCNLEIQQEFMQDRVKAIEKAKEITSQPGNMDIWNLRGHAASYDLIVPMILERIKEKNYGLIILDPLYKIYGDTDENSAGDMAALMNELERLAVKSRAAVVFGAHYSKGNQANKESIDRVSGSGVYGRDPDSILNFTKHEDAGAFVVEADLRNLPPLEPFVVKWQYPLMARDCGLNPPEAENQPDQEADIHRGRSAKRAGGGESDQEGAEGRRDGSLRNGRHHLP
jgi:AAA domain